MGASLMYKLNNLMSDAQWHGITLQSRVRDKRKIILIPHAAFTAARKIKTLPQGLEFQLGIEIIELGIQ